MLKVSLSLWSVQIVSRCWLYTCGAEEDSLSFEKLLEGP